MSRFSNGNRSTTGSTGSKRSIRFLSGAIRSAGCPGLLGLLGLLIGGCQSFNDPAPGSLASVTIVNRSQAQIDAATQSVFKAHGFQGGSAAPGQFVFTRPASRVEVREYGNFVDRNIIVRVAVSVTDLGDGSTVVSCTAKLVEDIGTAVFADVHRIGWMGKGPYQDLLNEIQAQLK